jgi:hypothetical protein
MCKTVLATSSSLWLLAGSTLGSCVPTATPDPVASKAARAEIAVCDSFLTEPLCETVAVKYQLASDYAILGDFDRTIALAAEVAQADQGFDFHWTANSSHWRTAWSSRELRIQFMGRTCRCTVVWHRLQLTTVG